MLALSVHLLTGRYVASDYSDRTQPEWPPAPARLFSALVAVWAEGGKDPQEEQALRWLERQDPPALSYSPASTREATPVFVPVNDAQATKDWSKQWARVQQAQGALDGLSGKTLASAERKLAKAQDKLLQDGAKGVLADGKASLKVAYSGRTVLPAHRVRQQRFFPSVTPESPNLQYLWYAEPPENVRQALDCLSGRVSRLGHSSSLVSVSCSDQEDAPTLVPDPYGDTLLRGVSGGQLDALQQAYAGHQGVEPRLLPFRPIVYAEPARIDLPATPRREWLVLERAAGARLSLSKLGVFVRALRGALMHHAPEQPTPEILRGHGRADHVALLPLPFVGRRYSDGQMMGAAVVLPPDCTAQGRGQVLGALAEWQRVNALTLLLGTAGEMQLRLRGTQSPKRTLQKGRWSGPARRWITATPVALDRHPGRLEDRNSRRAEAAADRARELIRAACLRQGLPAPERVELRLDHPLEGVPRARAFGPFPHKQAPGKPRRVLVHVALRFSEKIRGPLVLGAGRFLGLGLFQPLGSGQ